MPIYNSVWIRAGDGLVRYANLIEPHITNIGYFDLLSGRIRFTEITWQNAISFAHIQSFNIPRDASNNVAETLAQWVMYINHPELGGYSAQDVTTDFYEDRERREFVIAGYRPIIDISYVTEGSTFEEYCRRLTEVANLLNFALPSMAVLEEQYYSNRDRWADQLNSVAINTQAVVKNLLGGNHIADDMFSKKRRALTIN